MTLVLILNIVLCTAVVVGIVGGLGHSIRASRVADVGGRGLTGERAGGRRPAPSYQRAGTRSYQRAPRYRASTGSSSAVS